MRLCLFGFCTFFNVAFNFILKIVTQNKAQKKAITPNRELPY